ncbi:hypothetical protein ACXHXG_12940 [Rhizobium sp. LEGMi198b]
MTLINVIAAIAASCALVSGLIAAWYWWKSSQVSFDPWHGHHEPLIHEQWTLGIAVEFVRMSKEAAQLNAIAARWTAVTSVLAAIATLLPIFPVL